MKTEYRIIQEPTEIMFYCPHCGEENYVDWDDVESKDGEYGKWHGDIYGFECEECGEIVEFDDCEVD